MAFAPPSHQLPLAHLLSFPRCHDRPLGDFLADNVVDNPGIHSLYHCLPSTSRPAIWSPDTSRPPLDHRTLKDFVAAFSLPTSFTPNLLRNDRVALMLPTGPELAVMLICCAAYHTCAPINASATAPELREDVERLSAKAVVTTRDAVERLELQQLHDDLGIEIIFVDARDDGPAGLFDMDCLPSSTGARPPVTDPLHAVPPLDRLHQLSDQSLVLHTSGTSGKKKVVPYTLRTLIVGTACVIHSWELVPTDVNLNMMPLFHVGGIVRNLLSPVLSGSSAIMCPGFDAQNWWHVAVELKATWYYAAPTMHHAILAARPDDVVPSRDTAVRMIANAAGGLLPTLAQQLKDTFVGTAVLPSYGMTECMPIASPPTDYQLDRPGCSGLACGPELSIRDPFNKERELPRGSIGAVSVRGLPTFDGYEVSPDPSVPLNTDEFSRDGWFDSGDLGYMDADGYLFITGRSKEIINKGGEVISPFDVEEAVMTAAGARIKQTLAFAIEHNVLQETIGIVVVPVPNQPRIGLNELHNSLRAHLHPSKWPFAIVYMDDLPKNNAGKPLRIKLGQRLGIGCLSDDVPPLLRHFEAKAPNKNAPLTQPIPSKRVSVDVRAVERATLRIPGVREAAIRKRKDGTPEAFIRVDDNVDCDVMAAEIDEALSRRLHGYVVPSPLHVFTSDLLRKADGSYDFDAMEEDMRKKNTAAMSSKSLVVRDIVANVLDMDAGTITSESDFFLLGGNSLLLGRLVHFIRKETGVTLEVATLFNNSTIEGIARLIEAEEGLDMGLLMAGADEKGSGSGGRGLMGRDNEYVIEDDSETLVDEDRSGRRPSQTRFLALFVQILPLLLFYPAKAAWTWNILLHALSQFSLLIHDVFWERVGCLLASMIIARVTSRVISPLTAIVFKWIVLGKTRPGKYRMWSGYHLRWWIVNQSLRTAGRGIFSMHPALEKLYIRMLGANVGKDVKIDKQARLGEYDLLTLHDGCRIDKALVRGFCVERDGYFRLEPIVIGRDCVVNTYTQIAPGAVLDDGAVYGPQASSYDRPLPDGFAACNRGNVPGPHPAMVAFIGFPIVTLIKFISYLPWYAALFGLLSTPFHIGRIDPVQQIIEWFAYPKRIMWHYIARVSRSLGPPLLQLVLGVIVKRLMGLNTEASMRNQGQWSLLRRWINAQLTGQAELKRAFKILGTHYEMTSVVYRALGAKVGKRVYWPGSGIYCPDPELLEVGDDVVFGSRSEVFTTDSIGSAKVKIGRGAMIADRVVLMPGTTVGRQAVMGSGALSRRNGYYEDGSVWMGSKNGEAVSFGKTPVNKDAYSYGGGEDETITPFGRAFYRRQANFFVIPYAIIVLINVLMGAFSSLFWSSAGVCAVQVLENVRASGMRHPWFAFVFGPRWYRFGILYGIIFGSFVVVMSVQSLVAMAWVVVTKWIVIGRRQEGRYDWDRSSYCQRWQLHLVLSTILMKGHGNGGTLGAMTGSAYIVWFFRLMGAKIGKDCALWASGKPSLYFTEPELVELGDRVSIDDCSVVAHINSRGKFSLNKLRIGDGCALRSGSRLLSGASMEPDSMLLEHTLVASGEIAEEGATYVGWPARQLRQRRKPTGYPMTRQTTYS